MKLPRIFGLGKPALSALSAAIVPETIARAVSPPGEFETMVAGVMAETTAAAAELSKARAENMMLKAAAEKSAAEVAETLATVNQENAELKTKLAAAESTIATLTTERDTFKTQAETSREEIRVSVEADFKNRGIAQQAAAAGLPAGEVPAAILPGAGGSASAVEFGESLKAMDAFERSRARLATFQKPAAA